MNIIATATFRSTPAKGQNFKYKSALCILAIFTLLQVCFHLLVGRPEAHNEDEVECVGTSSDSAQCYEARIFRQWHNSAAAVAHGAEEMILATESLSNMISANESVHPHMHVLETLRVLKQVSSIDEMATAAEPASSLNSWGRSDASGTSNPPIEFEEAAEQIMKSDTWVAYTDNSASEDGDQVWARNLVSLQDRLEGRMKKLKLLQRDLSKVGTAISEATSAAHETHLSAWAQELMALQKQLEARSSALSAKHHSNSASFQTSTSFAPEVAASTTNLVQQIWDYGRELCKDPRRRNHASCAQFYMDGTAISSVSTTQPTADISSLEPTRSAVAAVALSQYERQHNLHWREVKSWRTGSASTALRGSEELQSFAVASKEDLRHSEWAGMIPKVACISVISKGKDIKHQLKYFVDNFKLQTYEGPRQLLFVYHHDDLAAKSMLTTYADGVLVKLVAAMGDSDESPAYRFGAWAAKDADVIARWDFDAWHHPSRLSMQVRAMALAKRPASRLTRWTMRSYAEGSSTRSSPVDTQSSPVDTLGEASLVGETTWMTHYWYPMLLNEAESLSKINRKHVVEFDFPELLVFDADS